MHAPRGWTALVALALGVGPLCAADPVDLAKLDRALGKEPAYQSKAPRYCLLVFGPEAKTRVWLVLDGDALFVDRNGNGDLTEPGERVETMKQLGLAPGDYRLYQVGTIADKDGKTKHTNLSVHGDGKNGEAFLSVTCADKVTMFSGSDCHGRLQFANRPQDAPIIHFGGPLTMNLSRELKLTRGGKKPLELYAEVGTPGLGKGTFAGLSYQQVPRDAHPVVEVTFPNANGNGPPLVVQATLNQRC